MSVALAADTLFVLSARILHVRRREMARTGMVALLAIVVGWGMSNGFNVTQAVFLTRAGVGSLPVFFIYLALTVWPMLALRGMITGRYGVGRSLGRILLVNVALALLLFLAYLESETPTVALVAALACSVCFELVMLLFWEFVSEHFNLLEGKRIFPVIAAGISLGYILSGVTVALVASLWSTERLMLAWAAGAAVSALLVFRIDSYLRHTTIEHEEGEHPEEKVAPTFGRALRSFGGALTTLF
jgi:ATP/ADP translocase